MRIIIPSQGRSDIIRAKALRLFPDATLCIGADEVDAYGRLSDSLLVHPPEVVGIGPLRQWVLDHVDDPCVVMVDDDVTHVYSQVGFHKERIEDADTARAIVERMAILAQDAGVRVFGFDQAARLFAVSRRGHGPSVPRHGFTGSPGTRPQTQRACISLLLSVLRCLSANRGGSPAVV